MNGGAVKVNQHLALVTSIAGCEFALFMTLKPIDCKQPTPRMQPKTLQYSRQELLSQRGALIDGPANAKVILIDQPQSRAAHPSTGDLLVRGGGT